MATAGLAPFPADETDENIQSPVSTPSRGALWYFSSVPSGTCRSGHQACLPGPGECGAPPTFLNRPAETGQARPHTETFPHLAIFRMAAMEPLGLKVLYPAA